MRVMDTLYIKEEYTFLLGFQSAFLLPAATD